MCEKALQYTVGFSFFSHKILMSKVIKYGWRTLRHYDFCL
jgi:hypothetical protein